MDAGDRGQVVFFKIVFSYQVPFHSASTTWTEKAMAPHSSTLAWKIPWTEDPGGPLSMGSLRIGHE